MQSCPWGQGRSGLAGRRRRGLARPGHLVSYLTRRAPVEDADQARRLRADPALGAVAGGPVQLEDLTAGAPIDPFLDHHVGKGGKHIVLPKHYAAAQRAPPPPVCGEEQKTMLPISDSRSQQRIRFGTVPGGHVSKVRHGRYLPGRGRGQRKRHLPNKAAEATAGEPTSRNAVTSPPGVTNRIHTAQLPPGASI